MNVQSVSTPPAAAGEYQRWIMVRANDAHQIFPSDSIDEACVSHRGRVMAPQLASNVPGAVGRPAREFNAVGRQVWTGRLLTVRGERIVRPETPARCAGAFSECRRRHPDLTEAEFYRGQMRGNAGLWRRSEEIAAKVGKPVAEVAQTFLWLAKSYRDSALRLEQATPVAA